MALTFSEDADVVYCGHREDISMTRVLSNVLIVAVGVAITRAGKALLLFGVAAPVYRVTILVMERASRRAWTARTRFCPVRHLISGARAAAAGVAVFRRGWRCYGTGSADGSQPMYVRSAWAMACAALLAASPVAGQSIAAGDSARPETVKRLLVVTKVEEFHKQMQKMIADQYAKVPAIAGYAEKSRAFLEKHASFKAIENDLIGVYREFYSESETRELIRFHESPLGQRVVTVTPLLTARLNQIVSERMAALLPELLREAGLPPAPPKP
jgi:hypothetical protein